MSLPLSVVIPTRDRLDKIEETLRALAGEDPGVSFEVIVVDDGSQVQSGVLSPTLPPLPYSLRFERQAAKGPAAARNLGISLARGERILLLGDDTRPAPGCLRLHLERGRGGAAIQGHIDWDPQREVTPLMDFLAPAGPQFYFAGLEDGQKISYRAVLGSNFSAPREHFVAEPFDEAFAAAAIEDTELAYRWQKRGFRLEFCRDAICWHHHLYTELAPFLARQERAGRSARLAVRRHRALCWSLLAEPWLYTRLIELRRKLGREKPSDGWDLACRAAYFRGFFAG